VCCFYLRLLQVVAHHGGHRNDDDDDEGGDGKRGGEGRGPPIPEECKNKPDVKARDCCPDQIDASFDKDLMKQCMKECKGTKENPMCCGATCIMNKMGFLTDGKIDSKKTVDVLSKAYNNTDAWDEVIAPAVDECIANGNENSVCLLIVYLTISSQLRLHSRKSKLKCQRRRTTRQELAQTQRTELLVLAFVVLCS